MKSVRRIRWTIHGRSLAILGGISFIIGFCIQQVLWIYLGLAGLLLALIALPLAGWNISGMRFRRDLPELVQASESFECFAQLHNRKLGWGGFGFKVTEFIKNRPVWSMAFSGLLPGQSREQWPRVKLRRRGVFPETRYVLRSTFPLRLVESRHEGVLPANLIVYPRPRRPRNLPAWMQSGEEHQGVAQVHDERIGDFRCLRDYRPGDPVKLVSWPVSSRRNQLVVREIESPAPDQTAILFHTYKPPGKVLAGQTFEQALELLAGLFLTFAEERIAFEFRADFNDWSRLAAWDESAGLNQALASLADAGVTASPSLEGIIQQAVQAADTAQSLWIVSNTPLRYWVDQIPPLPCRVVCLDHRDRVRILGGG